MTIQRYDVDDRGRPITPTRSGYWVKFTDHAADKAAQAEQVKAERLELDERLNRQRLEITRLLKECEGHREREAWLMKELSAQAAQAVAARAWDDQLAKMPECPACKGYCTTDSTDKVACPACEGWGRVLPLKELAAAAAALGIDDESKLVECCEFVYQRDVRMAEELASLRRDYAAIGKMATDKADQNVKLQDELATLRKRVEFLSEHLESTSDGVLVIDCDKLYCPKCKGVVRQEYGICYCDNCVNPDDGGWPNSPPLPLMYGSCLSKPLDASIPP